jgi:colanic acid/amylovoran biosynthesis glycosyltransferase
MFRFGQHDRIFSGRPLNASCQSLTTAPHPVVVHFCATFLKPEMLHIYRQITGLQRFSSVVFTLRRENAIQFPFEPVVAFPKPRTHQLRRLWQRTIRRGPIQIYPTEARRMARALDRMDASLLHIYFGHVGVLLLPLIELTARPVVVSFHGADGLVDLEKPRVRAATEQMLDKATLVLARSESLVERIAELGCPREKIRIHRTGIPLAELPFREREAPADGAWHFVQACRLIPKKGLTTTLRAFAGFTRDFPAARLTIAGEGPQREELVKLASELGIADRVKFEGFLSQAELRALYLRADAFLHPSELGPDGNEEGVPNSMLEAMATGLPVLATKHGGIPEAIDDGTSGLLVEERDVPGLETAMRRIAMSPELYKQLSRNGARAVAQRFEQSAQIAVLEHCYEEAIARHGRV